MRAYLRRALAVALAVLGLAGGVAASDRDAVARLQWTNTNCLTPDGLRLKGQCQQQTTMGSACIVGTTPDRSKYLILTAGHCFRGYQRSETVTLSFPAVGLEGRAEVLYAVQNDQIDLAILAIPYDGKHEIVPLAAGAPAVGTAVEVCGFVGGTDGRRQAGKVLDIAGNTIHYTGGLPEGSSGGPVFSGGQVVAVHWGIDTATRKIGYGTHASAVREVCRRKLGYEPVNPVDPTPPPQPAPTPAPTPPPQPAPAPQPAPEPPDAGPITLQFQAVSPDSTRLIASVLANTKRPVTVITIDADGTRIQKTYYPGELIKLEFKPQSK